MFYHALLAAVLLAGFRESWDRFRGPNGAGVIETGSLPGDLADPGVLRWKTSLPPGHSSPVVAGGRIFLTAYEGDALLTLCLRASDGKMLWRREAPRGRKEKLDGRNSPASPSPAVSDGRVAVFFPDFGLLAYDAGGRELWRTPLGPFQNVYGMGASPIIVDGRVILVCDQSFNSFIAAYDFKTGKQVWRTPRPEALSGHSTPVVYRGPDGEAQILAPASFRMDVYSARTGEAIWWVPGLPSEMKSTPVVARIGDKDVVFVSGFNTPENDPGRQVAIPSFEEVLPKSDADHDGKLTAAEVPDEKTRRYFPYIDLNGDGFMDAGEWRKYQLTMAAENGLLAIAPGGHGAAGILWKYHRGIPQLPSPAVYRGILYMINDAGVLTTLNAATGAVFKQGRLRGVSDNYFSSPVASDSKIYVAAKSGVFTVLAAGPDQQVLSSIQLDGEIYATPAISDGRIFLRTTSTLYCFGL